VFHHAQRLNRSGPGLAGVDPGRGLVWNGNWHGGPTILRSVDTDYTLELALNALKPPVIHGQNGVSQKAEGMGRASHYISLPRIAAQGRLTYENRELPVEGLVWMDHEYFTHQLEPNQAGWDWFSIQLQDNTELMLFRLRRKDGTMDPFSAGTYIDAQGKSHHLTVAEFQLIPGSTWTSDETGASYPVQWQIRVPSIQLSLNATTPLDKQEVVSQSSFSPSYWEGAVDYQGTRDGEPITGSGYLEMTGYDKPVTSL
jgi:predicted secreted hydrolase